MYDLKNKLAERHSKPTPRRESKAKRKHDRGSHEPKCLDESSDRRESKREVQSVGRRSGIFPGSPFRCEEGELGK